MDDNCLTIQMQNHSMMSIVCEPAVRQELSEHFKFMVPGAKFMPAVRNKVWDGYIRLFNALTSEINVGLYDKVKEFAVKRGYFIRLIETKYGLPNSKTEINEEQLLHFIENLDLPFKMREYQYNAVLHGLINKRCVLISPTGSGKSLIIYALTRWYLKQETEKKVLIIVPTTGLVEQLTADFADYNYNVEKNVHRIYSGKEKNQDKRVVISTWQSIHSMKRVWFDQYGCIFGDECHGFKAKSLSSIMNKSFNAEYRCGTTGTLDGTLVHELVLEGLFGPTFDVTTTKKLQDAKQLSDLNIKIVVLKHSEESKKQNVGKTYQKEIEQIVTNEKRNRFIRNLTLTQKGNTLVLFQFIEKQGKHIYDMLKEQNKPCYFIHGGVDTLDREAVRMIVEKKDNAIIVASYGTFSTGINIKNIHNIVFASPYKSQIKVLQSIGRGLRLSDNGQSTTLIDIVDDLKWQSYDNFALKHGADRLKIYNKQQFKCKTYEVDLYE